MLTGCQGPQVTTMLKQQRCFMVVDHKTKAKGRLETGYAGGHRNERLVEGVLPEGPAVSERELKGRRAAAIAASPDNSQSSQAVVSASRSWLSPRPSGKFFVIRWRVSPCAFLKACPPHRWAASFSVSRRLPHGVGERQAILLAACQVPETVHLIEAGGLEKQGTEGFSIFSELVLSNSYNSHCLSFWIAFYPICQQPNPSLLLDSLDRTWIVPQGRKDGRNGGLRWRCVSRRIW